MATLKEDYVSFEIAKLLKEKGFNEACWSWYHNGNNTHTGTSRYCNSELEKYDFSKVTLAHAMKWLSTPALMPLLIVQRNGLKSKMNGLTLMVIVIVI